MDDPLEKRKSLETETKILGVEITNTEKQQDNGGKHPLTHESMMYLLKYSLNSWASSSSKGHCNLEKLNIEYYGDDDGDNDGYDDEESDD